MDDAGAMRRRERIRSLDRERQHLIERQRSFLQPLLECLPFQVLHDQEVDAILAADVEHWADMRMTQGGQRFCL